MNKETDDFLVSVEADLDACLPWDSCDYDCYGEVREVLKGYAKKPYERLLSSGGCRARQYVYDMQATQQKAINVWRIVAHDGKSLRQCIAEAIEQDFQRLAAFVRGEWHYIGVVVTHAASGETASLWGIESDCTMSYLEEIIEELKADLRASVNSVTELEES